MAISTVSLPAGLCQCGCGQKTTLSPKTDRAAGTIKGQPRRFLKGHKPPLDPIPRFWANVTREDDAQCWEWQGARGTNGYGYFSVYGRLVSAHRFSFELANGSLAEDLAVCHHCDNPACVNPAHLFAGSLADNNADAKAKGRNAAGETHPRARLTWEQVEAIRARAGSGLPQWKVARDAGVSRALVGLIWQGKIWKRQGGLK